MAMLTSAAYCFHGWHVFRLGATAPHALATGGPKVLYAPRCQRLTQKYIAGGHEAFIDVYCKNGMSKLIHYRSEKCVHGRLK
ncbi:hypothetical protein [Nitratidesulfovibrio sp.]|uniref:hypothetical protein n=1 Tax=Nitratidesulfovibrio sp. TaxID=2802297 RepID=UPI0033400472